MSVDYIMFAKYYELRCMFKNESGQSWHVCLLQRQKFALFSVSGLKKESS